MEKPRRQVAVRNAWLEKLLLYLFVSRRTQASYVSIKQNRLSSEQVFDVDYFSTQGRPRGTAHNHVVNCNATGSEPYFRYYHLKAAS